MVSHLEEGRPSILQPTAMKRVCPVQIKVDMSGSMSIEGKDGSANYALGELAAVLRERQAQSPHLDIEIQVYSFGGTAQRVFPQPVSPADYRWTDLIAGGRTPLGAALDLACEDLVQLYGNRRCAAPASILVCDGQPNDAWEPALDRFDNSPLGKIANRVAVAIGSDCDHAMLNRFLAGSELGIIQAQDVSSIASAIMDATKRALSAQQAQPPQPTPNNSPAKPGLTNRISQRMTSLFGNSQIPKSMLDDPDAENGLW